MVVGGGWGGVGMVRCVSTLRHGGGTRGERGVHGRCTQGERGEGGLASQHALQHLNHDDCKGAPEEQGQQTAAAKATIHGHTVTKAWRRPGRRRELIAHQAALRAYISRRQAHQLLSSAPTTL